VFSSEQAVWDPHHKLLSHYDAPNSGGKGSYAVCSIPLPGTKVSSWDVKIENVNGNLVLGVVSSPLLFDENKKKLASPAYSVQRSTGWGMAKKVYTSDGEVENPDWPGWEKGDRGQFTYDPNTGKLTLSLQRTGKTYSLNTDKASNQHVHCYMKGSNKIDFSSA
jgi:hypothetical protein